MLPKPVAWIAENGRLLRYEDNAKWYQEKFKLCVSPLFTAEQVAELMEHAVGEVTETKSAGMDTSDAHDFIESFRAAYCKNT